MEAADSLAPHGRGSVTATARDASIRAQSGLEEQPPAEIRGARIIGDAVGGLGRPWHQFRERQRSECLERRARPPAAGRRRDTHDRHQQDQYGRCTHAVRRGSGLESDCDIARDRVGTARVRDRDLELPPAAHVEAHTRGRVGNPWPCCGMPPSVDTRASSIARPSASWTRRRTVCIWRGRSGPAASSVAT